MTHLIGRFSALSLLFLAFASTVPAQNYPMPGSTSQAPVICTGCFGILQWNTQSLPNAGLPTYPYAAPLTRFAGRFIDSQIVRDYQSGFGMRTLRARGAIVAPERNRIYMMLGDTFASYDLNRFFSQKLGGAMIGNSYFGAGSYHRPGPEKYLAWDDFIYPEGPASGWQYARGVDIQQFLYGMDYDDRNYVYLAYTAHGWGIVRDNADASLDTVAQVFPDGLTAPVDVIPGDILSFKAGGRYYVLTKEDKDKFSYQSMLFDVTNASAPVYVRTLRRGQGNWYGAVTWAKVRNGSDQDVVITDNDGIVRVYTGAGVVNGSTPQSFNPTVNLFKSVTSDGTNFFAVEHTPSGPESLRFSVFARTGSTYAVTRYATGEQFDVGGIEYGAGFLTIRGLSVGSSGYYTNPDVKVFKLTGLVPSQVNVGDFFRYYYSGKPPVPVGSQAYAKPEQYTGDVYGAVMANYGGRDYLIWSGRGLGDVFEFNGPGTPIGPGPSPTPTPSSTPTPTPTPPGPTPTPGGPTPTPQACGQPQLLDVNFGCPGGTCVRNVNVQFFPVDFYAGSRFTGNCTDSFSWNFGDGTTSNQRNPSHAYSNNGTYNVRLTVTPSGGTPVQANRDVQVGGGGGTPTPTPPVVPTPTPIPPPSNSCNIRPTDTQVSLIFRGATSTCTQGGGNCAPNETVNFDAEPYYYNYGTCHTFEWDFGDGLPKLNTRTATHSYASGGDYTVTLKVTNAGGTLTLTKLLRVGGTGATPITSVDFTATPTAANVNQSVTFDATALPAETGTSYSWNFDDGTPVVNGKTVSHTFAAARSYSVTVTATRGASSAARSQAVVVSNPNQFAFLLPVVAHQPGQGGTLWRTDVQIFNPDPNFNPASPLMLEIDFKGTKKTLTVDSSTLIRTDFMSFFTTADDAGPMIIRGNHPFIPQIWTRTYNVAQSGEGTYGQFVPAVRLQSATGSLGVGGSQSFLAGLESSADVRTNLGIINPTGTAFDVQVIAFPENSGVPLGLFMVTVPPYQLQQINDLRTRVPALPLERKYSLRVTNLAGTQMIAYHSAIDQNSNDPVYIQGSSVAEAQPEANKVQWVPGVAHLAVDNWKTDLTIFNPDELGVQFDLTYYDAAGVALAPKSYTLEAKHFMYLRDVLVSGFLIDTSTITLGSIKVETKSVGVTAYPMIYARTYSDQGPRGTYGQGIPAFAGARANVGISKDAYIGGVRSTTSFVTNLGLLSVSTEATVVEVTLLDRINGRPIGTWPYNLAPNQSVIHPNVIRAMHPTADEGSLRIRVISGGPVWAYASIKDTLTKDPEYVPAVGTP